MLPTSIQEVPMAKDNVLERLKKLDEERSKLIESAFGEALKEAENAVEQLNLLGYNYELVDMKKPARKAAGGTKREMRDLPCKICGYKTDKLHDARAHRFQGDDKKPFTPAELKELGMVRVD